MGMTALIQPPNFSLPLLPNVPHDLSAFETAAQGNGGQDHFQKKGLRPHFSLQRPLDQRNACTGVILASDEMAMKRQVYTANLEDDVEPDGEE